MMKIAKIDGADILTTNAQNELVQKEFSFTDENGRFKEWLFTNTLDDSMTVDQLLNKMENNRVEKKFTINGGKATKQVINVNFEHVVSYQGVYKNGPNKGKPKKTPEKIARKDIREYLYINGFTIDDIHYVRWNRSGGAARVGKCLFINEQLLHNISMFTDCGIPTEVWDKGHHNKSPNKLDLASFEAYRALPLSGKIDDLVIKPKNILIIDDYKSWFTETVMATDFDGVNLTTEKKEHLIDNDIWDGQSLIDVSLMGKYKHKGMVLLRHKMFKSCAFNCNIQQWFKDNNITDVRQLNGFTLATDIKDVKFITTANSIKYCKFGGETWKKDWLKLINDIPFGIVKYEKETKHVNGEMVQTTYQLLNTLQMTREEVAELFEPTNQLLKLMSTDPLVMRWYCGHYTKDTSKSVISQIEMMKQLLDTNYQFSDTSYYTLRAKKIVEDLVDQVKHGKVYVNGNYSTVCSCPIEMLQAAVGAFYGEQILPKGNIVSTRFKPCTVLCSRNPHVTMGNVLVTENVRNELIEKYMNLTNEIVVINTINENIMQRMSGMDMDSDTMLITDNPILIKAGLRNYDKFLVPTNLINPEKKKVEYTAKNLADLDNDTSENYIGQIINFSQVLNSYYWHCMNNGIEIDFDDLYKDICQLDCMSGVEIDKAKKDFGTLKNANELPKMRNKYKNLQYPAWLDWIGAKSSSMHISKKNQMKFDCTMQYLFDCIGKYPIKHRKYKDTDKEYIIKMSRIYKCDDYKVNQKALASIEELCNKMVSANANRSRINHNEDDIESQYCFDYEQFACAMRRYRTVGKGTCHKIITMLEDDNYKDQKQKWFYALKGLLEVNCQPLIKLLDDERGYTNVLKRAYGDYQYEIFGTKYYVGQEKKLTKS
jgi:hypothetical protein